MNRIRVLLSLGLLVAAASLASAGSFGPTASGSADCPPGCCGSCPLPCAPEACAD